MADEFRGAYAGGGRQPGARRGDGRREGGAARSGRSAGGRGRQREGARRDGGRPARERTRVSPARAFALQVGTAVREREAFTHDVIESQIAGTGMSDEDKAFATKLALGVTMSLGTLDEQIDRFVSSPTGLDPEVRDALRVSAYEILFLDKSAHAAVDQGVELVRSVEPRAAGLANAVLRKLVAAREQFPFGNPEASLQAAARQQAFPVWLAKTVLEDRGPEALKSFMATSNEVAPLYFAVNALKVSEGEALAAFQRAGADVEPVRLGGQAIPRCWKANNHRAIGKAEIAGMLRDGKLIVSDASAQAIARIAVPRRMPERFLEVGAGRGTKSILLQNAAQERFGAQMPLETVDNLAFKTKLQVKRAKLTDVRLDRAHTLDAQRLHAEFGNDAFDAVFVDAPCSGLGTLRRHPEIRWRITVQDIEELARLDAAILQEAGMCLRVGGLLTYATCTVTRKENERVVERFLRSSIGQRFRIVPLGQGEGAQGLFFASNLRSGGPDAHFAAQFVRVR